MNTDGPIQVDIDGHLLERIDEAIEYMDDGPWKEKFEQGVVLDETNDITTFWPKAVFSQADLGVERSEHHTKPDILRNMERMGTDKIIVIGEQMLLFGNMRGDDPRPIKYAEAYTDYVLDNIADPEAGIYVTIPIAHSDPQAAVDLIERVGDKNAVVAACIVPSRAEPPFGNRRYDPIYDACQEHDLPVMFHSAGPSLDDYHLRGFETTLETHTLGFVLSNMNQMTSLIIQGVPERFPDLDIIFLEAGLFYIPMLMWRLDSNYLKMPNEAPLLTKLPSEYMREFYYGQQPLEIVPNSKYYQWLIEMIGGPERLMWASDWPHADSDEPNVITDLPFLSKEEKEMVLGETAQRVFGI